MDAIRRFEREGVKVFKNVEETGCELGRGSYGSVVELCIKGSGKFAGKKIHEFLIIDTDPVILVKEMKVLMALEHPHIVRFYGICRLKSSTIPVMVMELMHQSLEDAIASKTTPLKYSTALSILLDVANGLAYLHCYTPRVYHRDLTARNVLLDREMKAKLSDFGNSKIIDPAKVGVTMTQVPGTCVYMPPEAFDAKSKNSDRLDIFSFGHLALCTIIKQFPAELLPPTYNFEGKLVARSEVERRQEYMDMLKTSLPTPDHYMYQLIEQCLHNDPTKRPSAVELLFWLQEISRLDHRETTSGADVGAEKVEIALQQMQGYINKRPAEDVEDFEKRPLKLKPKVGLIEKKSVGLLGGRWKAYQFTLDYDNNTFHYSRLRPFGPSIKLDNITEVRELDPENSTFPFEVHFKGSNNPWVLRTYSENERRDWKEALQSHPSKMSISSPQMATPDLQAEEKDPVMPATSGAAANDGNLEKVINDLKEKVDILAKKLDEKEDETSENIYVELPEYTPEMVPPPAVNIIPPSPTPRRGRPKSGLHYMNLTPTEGEPIFFQHKSPVRSNSVNVSPISSTIPPSRAPQLPRVRSLPENLQHSAVQQHDQGSYHPYYEQVRPLSQIIASPRPTTLLATSPDPLDEPIYTDPIPPHESLNITPPSRQRPMALQPMNTQHPIPIQMSPGTPTLGHQPYHGVVHRDQISAPHSPVTSADLHKLFLSVHVAGNSENDECIYEDLNIADSPPPVAKPVLPPLQPPLPPLRQREIDYLNDEEEICADLEDLQRKALSISLSSLSHMSEIGKGQFGEVYRAEMGKTTVALKIINRFSSQDVMDQFEDEMSIMSQFYHHNIVKVFGILREGPFCPALVMEFLPNGDLKTFLGKETQPTEFLMKCMTDVAMGMHYLCERGLIHRDLAARNVLLDKDKTCKVSDFGLLREVPKDKNIYITQGDGPSPVRWMAPESITDNIFSSASDVWSYGILQWEMFFPDQDPYHDMDNMQVVAKVASGHRMLLPEGCPGLVGKIMRACWQHDPRKRPTFQLISSLLTRRDRLLL